MSEPLPPFHPDPEAAPSNPAASLTHVVVRRDRGRARTDIGKGTMHGPEVQAAAGDVAAADRAEDAPLPQQPPPCAPEQKPAQAAPQPPTPTPAPQSAPPPPPAAPAAPPDAAAGAPGPAQANGAAATYAQRARMSAASGEASETVQNRASPQAGPDQPRRSAPPARHQAKPKPTEKAKAAPDAAQAKPKPTGKAATDAPQAKPTPPKPAPEKSHAAMPAAPTPASTESAAKPPPAPAPKAKTPAETQRRRPLVAPEPPRAEREAEAQSRAAKPDSRPAPSGGAAAHPSEKAGTGAAPAGPQGLVALWKHSAGTRDFPAIEDIDLGAIAENWPNSLLLRVHEGGRPDVEVVRIFRSHTVEAMDTVTIERMMALVRETGRSGEPMHESDPVQSGNSENALGIIALPFGRAPDAVDHVLCHAFRHGGAAAPSAAPTRGRIAEPEPQQGQRSVFSKLFGW